MRAKSPSTARFFLFGVSQGYGARIGLVKIAQQDVNAYEINLYTASGTVTIPEAAQILGIGRNSGLRSSSVPEPCADHRLRWSGKAMVGQRATSSRLPRLKQTALESRANSSCNFAPPRAVAKGEIP